MKIDRVATTPGEVLREEFIVPYELQRKRAGTCAGCADQPDHRGDR